MGSTITFDGRLSSDPDGDPLDVGWNLDLKPILSQIEPADLLQPVLGVGKMVPDAAGGYKIRLTVSDRSLSATASALVVILGDGIEPPVGNGGKVDFVCPTVGAIRGNDEIRFYGGPFPENSQVRFGDVPATETRVLEDGAVLVAVTPKVESRGVVDVTIDLDGDQVILLRGVFTFIEGPLEFKKDQFRDFAAERSPTSLAAVGNGRLLAGLPRGRVQLFTRQEDGSVIASAPLQLTGEAASIVKLSASPVNADGSIDVVAIGDGGLRVFVVRVSPSGVLSRLELPFDGQAVSAIVQDFEPGGAPEVAVADRADRTLEVYHLVVTSGGARYLPLAEYPLGGAPCTVTAGQLDGDPDLEIVVGNLPGPEITIIDPGPTGARAVNVDLSEIEGVLAIRTGIFGADGRPGLAAIARESDGQTALRFLGFVPPTVDGSRVDGPTVELDPETRFRVDDDGAGIEVNDLDLDSDSDIALHDGSSGAVRLLRNTASGEPETDEECAQILATGSRGAVPRFRESTVPSFESPGLQAVVSGDWNGDGLPDLAVSHQDEVRGVRVLTNGTGK